MKTKRIFSLLLTVVLLLTAIPFAASAVDENGNIDATDLGYATDDARLVPYVVNSQYYVEQVYNSSTQSMQKRIVWSQDGASLHGIGYTTKNAAATADLFSQPFTMSVTLYRDGSNPGPSGRSDLLHFESGSAKVRVTLGYSTLRFNDSTAFYTSATSSALEMGKNTWHTLKLWIDPTKNEDNVKVYLNGTQLLIGSSRSETASLDFSTADTEAMLTMMHNGNGGFTNVVRISDFSIQSDDTAASGAYDFSMNMNAIPVGAGYGVDYSLFADEGDTADDALVPYVRGYRHFSDWSLTSSQYSSNTYTIYAGTMPVDMTILTMNESTDKETPVAMYTINTSDPDAKDLSAAENIEIIMELLKMGFIVVVTDFGDNPDAVSPDLNWAIKAMRIKLSDTSVVAYPHHDKDIYLVPEGYLVARNLMFFDFEEHAAKGAEEYIVSMFNGVKKGTDWSTKTTVTNEGNLPAGTKLGKENGVTDGSTFTYYLQNDAGVITKTVATTVDQLPEGVELGEDKGVTENGIITYYLQGEDETITKNETTTVIELGGLIGAEKGVSNMTTYTYYMLGDDGTITKNVTTYSGFRYQKLSSIPVDEEAAARGEYETYGGVYTRVSGNEVVVETKNPVVICDANGNPIPKRVTATDFESCLNKDGTPVELRLNQDIIYPATEKDAPVVLISSSAEEKMGVCSVHKERALDDAFLLNGCAVVFFEHVYSPMSRTDHYGYFSPGFSMNGHLAAHVQSAAVRCIRYFADTYGYSTENYGAMGHSKGSCAAFLSSPNPEKIEEESTFANNVKGDNYGEQPYLCYEDGTPIKSGVDVVYSSMGPGINNYRKNFISEGGAKMLLACGLWDTDVSDSWSWWTSQGLVTDFEEYGVEYVAMTELELEHDYPYLVDNYYNYDRYMAFSDMITFHLKDGMSNRILYSSIVDSRVVDRAFDADGDGTADATITLSKPQYATEANGLGDSVLGIVTGNVDGKIVGSVTVTGRKVVKGGTSSVTLTRGTDLYVQFLASVTEQSVNEHMYLKDASGNLVAGKLVGTAGGTKWEFVPDAALTDGTTYTLVVEAGIVDVKNGTAITDSANYTFTWGE